jgi:hypothetical protein
MASKLRKLWDEWNGLIVFIVLVIMLLSGGVWFGLEHTELRHQTLRGADRACQSSQPESCVGESQHVDGMSTRSYWLCACPCDGGEAVLHQAPRG